jgi:hypothetical protein
MGPIRGAAWNREGFLIVDVQQLSRKLGLLVIFAPISELRDFIVPRLPKQNRQVEEEPRQLPIRSSCKRVCGTSGDLAEFSRRTICCFSGQPVVHSLGMRGHISRAASADAPASSARMRRLEIVITRLPGPPSCAPRRCVLDDSSHTSYLS